MKVMAEMVFVVVGLKVGSVTQEEKASTSYPFVSPFDPCSVVFTKKEKINLDTPTGEAKFLRIFKKAARSSDFVSVKIVR